jgi:cell division protein FtsW
MAETSLPPQFVEDEYDETTLEQRALERRRNFTATVDVYLILTVGILVAIGLMMVWSTTFFWSDPQYAIFMQQVRNAAIGGVLMGIMSLINYRVWRRLAIPLMTIVAIALLGVLVLPGVKSVFGAKRAFFDGAVQPSEVALLVVTIYMAAWLSSKQGKLKSLTYGLLPFAILVGTVAGLVILEPDLSTASLILITATVMFFLAGADWFQMFIAAGVFVGAGYLAISNIDYARARVTSWIDLLRDPLTQNAQHAQMAIIAFLNGGLTGVGLGQSYQKFHALPAPHTDSIFAVIGEELGLLGCALVIALFVVLLVRGFRISRNAPDSFGALLAAGITVSIVLEALLNIAVMAAVVPFTGVPLPFISFGGSSLVAAMTSIGVLISISRTSAKKSIPTRKTNETLNLANGKGSISRVRQRPIDN